VFQRNVLCVSTYLFKLLLENLEAKDAIVTSFLNTFSIQWNAHLLECISFLPIYEKLVALGYQLC